MLGHWKHSLYIFKYSMLKQNFPQFWVLYTFIPIKLQLCSHTSAPSCEMHFAMQHTPQPKQLSRTAAVQFLNNFEYISGTVPPSLMLSCAYQRSISWTSEYFTLLSEVCWISLRDLIAESIYPVQKYPGKLLHQALHPLAFSEPVELFKNYAKVNLTFVLKPD